MDIAIISCMPILSRRARHLRGKDTALDHVLDDWYAVSETATANSTFSILESHDHGLIVSLAEHGGCEIRAEDQHIPFQPKQMLLIRPRTTYHEHVFPDSNWRASYLVFHGPLAERFADTFWAEDRHNLRLLDTAPLAWHHDAREIIRLSFAQPPHWDWLILKTLSQLFEQLVNHYDQLIHRENLSACVKSTVSREIHRPWSIEELAGAIGVSVSQLAHEFRRQVGTSPGQWVREARLKHARSLLRQGLSVTQVADEMGYANPFNFTRAYKTAYGVAPSTESGSAPKVLH